MTVAVSAVDAVLLLLRGVVDLDVVRVALRDRTLCRVLALIPCLQRLPRTLALMASAWDDALLVHAHADIDAAVDHAIRALIAMGDGTPLLNAWVRLAPKGWGESCFDLLVSAAQRTGEAAGPVAALVGPDDRIAGALTSPADIAYAIRWWGASSADDPTWWMQRLSSQTTARFLRQLRRHPLAVAQSLPWLPNAHGRASRVPAWQVSVVLDVCADLPHVTPHIPLVRELVWRAAACDLGRLIRIAMRTGLAEVWRRVDDLARAHPDHAAAAVRVAPWDDLSDRVRTAILGAASDHPLCLAITRARGLTSRLPPQTRQTAAVFFAALDPDVWQTLDAPTQQAWVRSLHPEDVHLAVRSLGIHPETLCRACDASPALTAALRRHTHDRDQIAWTLLPIALKSAPISAAHAILSALPAHPPDQETFFRIAAPPADRAWHEIAPAVRHDPTVLADAVTLVRVVSEQADILDRVRALESALQDRAPESVRTVFRVIRPWERAVVAPDPHVLVDRLAEREQRTAMLRVLTTMDALPPHVAVPAFHALAGLVDAASFGERRASAHALAYALRRRGDIFVALVASANASMRAAMLPLPHNAEAHPIVLEIAGDDPLAAFRLAHALRTGHDVECVWRDMPHDRASALWKRLPHAVKARILHGVRPLIRKLAAPGQAHHLISALSAHIASMPLDEALHAISTLRESARNVSGNNLLSGMPIADGVKAVQSRSQS